MSRITDGVDELHPSVIDRIQGDRTPWEAEPLTSLAEENKLMAYYHHRKAYRLRGANHLGHGPARRPAPPLTRRQQNRATFWISGGRFI